MRRRSFLGGLAIAPLAGGIPISTALEAASGGAVPASWRGATVLRGGKGYAACPLGQMHYRQVDGHVGVPVLLLHQTPLSMAEYAEIQPALARLGRASVAVDNPSYGMSDPAGAGTDMGQLADNLVALLDHLGIKKAILAGHHTGASIAIAFAARHPDRTAALISHGTPFYTAAERAERLARPAFHPALKADGSHLVTTFREVLAQLGGSVESVAPATWSTVDQFLADPASPVYHAVFTYDMARDLARLRAPTLILSSVGDVLYDNDARVAALRPDFTVHELPAGHSLSLLDHADRWAGVVHTFAGPAAV